MTPNALRKKKKHATLSKDSAHADQGAPTRITMLTVTDAARRTEKGRGTPQTSVNSSRAT